MIPYSLSTIFNTNIKNLLVTQSLVVTFSSSSCFFPAPQKRMTDKMSHTLLLVNGRANTCKEKKIYLLHFRVRKPAYFS